MNIFHLDEREVLQQEYSQPPILPSPHFRWVVKHQNNAWCTKKRHCNLFPFSVGKNEETRTYHHLELEFCYLFKEFNLYLPPELSQRYFMLSS